VEYELDYLKKATMTESYTRFNNFMARVLEPAEADINEYSDLMIQYEPLKEERAFTRIRFFIRYKKTIPEGMEALVKIEEELNKRRNAESVEM
jgi:plasmid replication initiation protein